MCTCIKIFRSIYLYNYFSVSTIYYAGSAYVYGTSDNGATYSERQKLVASDGAAYDDFGSAVSVYGYTIVVGAVYDDDKGTDSGGWGLWL